MNFCGVSPASSAAGLASRPTPNPSSPTPKRYDPLEPRTLEGPLSMLKLLTKIVGDPNARELKKLQPLVDEINGLEAEMAELNDEQLRDQTAELKQRLAE